MIRTAETEADIERCYPVMAELRPHVPREAFVERVLWQTQDGGYRLAFLEEEGEVRAVGGFRIFECLAWGRVLYIDDLVTAATHRSKRYGRRLLDWIVDLARTTECDQVHLDSGVQRFDAHRFYLGGRFDITSHHFALNLRNPAPTE